MKITSLEIKNFSPIKNLKIETLGNVVIIAGANGSGKTRLKDAIVQTLQGQPQMSLMIQATRDRERAKFGGDSISVQQGQQNQILTEYMQSRRFGRGRFVGSLVQVDSERNIQTIQYNPVSYLVKDPDDQETPSNFYSQIFTNRWQIFMDDIHKKVAAYKNKIADEVKNNPIVKGKDILSKFPHPLEKYKNIFKQLLQGKELQDIDPASPGQFTYKDISSPISLPFNSLSSGEQEVIKVIFDVAKKDIRHSVIIIDEPELHLHPILAFKLIETLKTIGDHTNQFIFLTHSADLISTYYSTGDVYFIDTVQVGINQAHKLSELNRSHKELVQLISQNLGLFAVGKKLIFVEGEDASIDRLTYHSIAQKHLPEAIIIPMGSVENLITLNAFEEQIRNSIFGIELYMIRDRDGLSDEQIKGIEQNGKIKCLKKRHIENYFFDPGILFKVAKKLYITTTKPAVTQDFIEFKLKEIATDSIKLNLLQNIKRYLSLNHNFHISTVKSLETKALSEIKTEMTNSTITSLNKLSDNLSDTELKKWMDSEQGRLKTSLTTDDWKDSFHGKQIFERFCSDVFNEDKIKVRQAYIDIALDEKLDVFDDIKKIFDSFK